MARYISRTAAGEVKKPATCSFRQQKNYVNTHSFLDKDFKSVYLLSWSFFVWP